MRILTTKDYMAMDNPTPDERYRLDLVTVDQMAKELHGFLAILPAGQEVPYHYHEKRESLIFVISGEATEIVEGEEFCIKAGDVLYIPAKEKHSMVNRSEHEVRYLEFFTPIKTDVVEVK
jgi:quercetin dioxygenase-like cupin family protein